MYKDRYPFDFIEKNYISGLKRNIISIAFCSIYGLAVILHPDYLYESIYFIAISLFTIFLIGFHVYISSKTVMVANYVEKYCKTILDKFNDNNCNIDDTTFEELNKIFEECIIKEEFSVAQKVSMCTGGMFREFMKKSIEFIDKGENSENVEKSFKKIAFFGREQLKKCIELESSILKDDILFQQYKNIEFCIETNQSEFFKMYLQVLNRLLAQAQKECNNKLVDVIFELYSGVLEKTVEENKDELTCFLLNNTYELTRANSYFFTNDYVKNFIALLTIGMVNEKSDKTYETMFDLLEKITFKMSIINDGFSSLVIYYSVLFFEIKDNRPEYLKQYVEKIIGDNSLFCRDSKWIEFKFQCLNEVCDNDSCNEKVDDYRLGLLTHVIELKDTYRGYFSFPDFNKKLYEGSCTKEKLEKICEDLFYIFNRSVVSDNIEFYYITLQKLDECLKKSTKSHKDIQISLFEIYIWLIERTRRLNNKKFLDMSFVSMQEVLSDLDKERKISEGFGEQIIKYLQEVAQSSDSKSKDVVINIIDLLFGFVKKDSKYQFSSKKEVKTLIAKAIYNIGISCVENDYEEGIRMSSNSLGWMIVNEIEQGTVPLVKYIISLAKKMLEISEKLCVTPKTKTFLITLFTTVGMFCYKEPEYYIYINEILDVLVNEDKKIVEVAIEMRTYENDMWDSLFGDKTSICLKNFRKEFNKKTKN